MTPKEVPVKQAQTTRIKQTGKQPGKAAEAPLIKQFQFLQQNLGNQKVQELVADGTLGRPEADIEELALNRQRLDKKEQQQMEQDRAALAPQIEKNIAENRTKILEMYKRNANADIYVNVSTQRHYVTPPGGGDMDFYHFTSLDKVEFSFINNNQIGSAMRGTRGYTLPVIDSFAFRIPAEWKQLEEETGEEEKAVNEEAEAASDETKTILEEKES